MGQPEEEGGVGKQEATGTYMTSPEVEPSSQPSSEKNNKKTKGGVQGGETKMGCKNRNGVIGITRTHRETQGKERRGRTLDLKEAKKTDHRRTEKRKQQ